MGELFSSRWKLPVCNWVKVSVTPEPFRVGREMGSLNVGPSPGRPIVPRHLEAVDKAYKSYLIAKRAADHLESSPPPAAGPSAAAPLAVGDVASSPAA